MLRCGNCPVWPWRQAVTDFDAFRLPCDGYTGLHRWGDACSVTPEQLRRALSDYPDAPGAGWIYGWFYIDHHQLCARALEEAIRLREREISR